jgi:UDPglucose 6-dehydrogenase
MKIAVVGTGYVGLVTGTCLAETGNDVVCVDCDRKKIDVLNRGEIPIYEPGLASWSSRIAKLMHRLYDRPGGGEAPLVFLAGTPSVADGSADLSARGVVDDIAPHLNPGDRGPRARFRWAPMPASSAG